MYIYIDVCPSSLVTNIKGSWAWVVHIYIYIYIHTHFYIYIYMDQGAVTYIGRWASRAQACVWANVDK